MTLALNTTLAEPLIEACSEGRFKDVAALLESGADPNVGVEELGRYGVRTVRPLTAIFRVMARADMLPKVAQHQVHRIITALIEAGARVRLADREMLIYAVRMGLPETLQFLVEHGARAHRFGHELMESAIVSRKLECIDVLAKLGIDPNVRDQWGSTTFLDVCFGNLSFDPRPASVEEMTRLIRQLMDHGLDINVTDRLGTTALMRSIVGQQDTIMQALLACGARADLTLPNGVCAAHLAAHTGSVSRLRMLLGNEHVRKDLERLNVKRLQPDVKAFLAALMTQPWAGEAQAA